MKPIIMLCMLCMSVSFAQARAKIPVGKIEQLSVVNELPDTEDYQASGSGNYLDLARLHEEFNIGWVIPVWVTKEPKLVLASEGSDMYYDLTDEQLNTIIAANGLNQDQLLGLPMYTRFGGKAVLLVLIGFMVYGLVSGGHRDTKGTEDQLVVQGQSTGARGAAADPITQGHIVASTNSHVASGPASAHDSGKNQSGNGYLADDQPASDHQNRDNPANNHSTEEYIRNNNPQSGH